MFAKMPNYWIKIKGKGIRSTAMFKKEKQKYPGKVAQFAVIEGSRVLITSEKKCEDNQNGKPAEHH